jgi:hypothetical protein
VAGIYQNGAVELLELPDDVNEAQVIVTFLPKVRPPLFTPAEMAELRGKLAAWEDDWNVPGMEAYDDYETQRCGAGLVSSK